MKLMRDGEVVAETHVRGVMTGTRCDAIQLDLEDFRRLSSMDDRDLVDYMFEHLMTKLVPR